MTLRRIAPLLGAPVWALALTLTLTLTLALMSAPAAAADPADAPPRPAADEEETAPADPVPPADARPPAPRPPAAPNPAHLRLRPGETSFDAASWRAFAGGRTVLYFDAAGELDGLEAFDRAGDRATWRFTEGPCERGRWTERGGVFCFDYPSGYFCYRHVRRGDGVFVRNVTTGKEFSIRLDDRPVACAPPEVSGTEPNAPPAAKRG